MSSILLEMFDRHTLRHVRALRDGTACSFEHICMNIANNRICTLHGGIITPHWDLGGGKAEAVGRVQGGDGTFGFNMTRRGGEGVGRILSVAFGMGVGILESRRLGWGKLD